MRGVLVLGLAVAGLMAAAPGSGGGWTTSLKVTYWSDGSKAVPDAVWTLRCNPAGGTLARPAQACRALALGGARLFVPTPPGAVCTQIYGGPQRARIVGTVGRKQISTTVSRKDGCEISRWQRLSPWLLPRGGVI